MATRDRNAPARLHMQRGRSTSPRPSPILPPWVPGILFILTTAAFFWANLTGSRFFWEDFIEQFYPNQVFAARHWAHGTLPFWNPYTFCGMPFLADPQVGFFYLPHSLLGLTYLLLGTVPFWVVQTLVIAHFILAQWGMYQLSRSFGASPLASLLVGIGYGFSGILTHHAIHPMIVYHLAWLPWILWLLKGAIEEARWQRAVGAGLLLGMSLHAGHPQTILYTYLLLISFGLWLVGSRGLQYKRLPLLDIARLALPLVLAAGMVAVQYLPTQELASLSERSAGQGLEWAAEVSLLPQQILTLITPKLFGSTEPPGQRHVPLYLPGVAYYHYWETAFYVGIPILLLALVGILQRWRTPLGLFWIGALAFSLLFAFGKYGFLFPLLYQLPGFSLFRVPPRILFISVLALCLFAAWGFDALWHSARHRPLLLHLGWAAAFIAGIALLVSTGILPTAFQAPKTFLPQLQSEGTVALWLTVLSFLTTLALWRGWVSPLLAGGVLTVILTVDLTRTHAPFVQSSAPPERFYNLDPHLKRMLQPNPPAELFRVSMRADFGMAMLRNQGLLDSIMLYEGYNQLRLQRRNPPMPTAEATFDILNIRYRIAFDTASGRLYFQERPTALPRAWMVYRARVVPSDSTEAVLRRGEINPRIEALLEQAPPQPLLQLVPDMIPHSVECLLYEHNSQRWKVQTAKPGLLCLSEIWYPAWKAFLDGKETPILRAYHSLRAVAIPAGTHIVELRYDSEPFRIGAWISSLSTLGGLLALVLLHRRRTMP